MENTKFFNIKEIEQEVLKEDIAKVIKALEERGYNPISQISGYLISNDPAYITAHKNARNIITTIGRDDLLETILRFYIDQMKK